MQFATPHFHELPVVSMPADNEAPETEWSELSLRCAPGAGQ